VRFRGEPIGTADGRARAAASGARRPNGRRSIGRPKHDRSASLDAAFALGLAAAVPAFAATFRGPRDRFWSRMTTTGLVLGGLALVANPRLRRTRIGPREVAVGLASAAALYGTFKIGDRFARRFVPGGDAQIRDIYSLRELAPRGETARGWSRSSARPRSCSGAAWSRKR
jgi:hypothetical protein